MKIKVYKVWPKNKPELYCFVDAPNKRIARWCGAAVFNESYASFFTNKDMTAERWRYKED